VLDIGFATSDSGDNVVLAIDQSNGGGSNVEIKHADTESGKAAIITGDVVAVGDGATVTVCQSFHDAAACAVKTTTRTPKPPTVSDPDPADPPAVTVDAARASIDPPAAPAAAVSAGESLPFTGGESRTLTELGLALVALGAVASRRRRRLR